MKHRSRLDLLMMVAVNCWLVRYEGIHPLHRRLWHILRAMPEELRLDYLNDVCGVIGTLVCGRQQDGQNIDAIHMAVSLTKEQMDAQVSVIELGDCPEIHAAKAAYREVSEAVTTGAAVLDVVGTNLSSTVRQKKSC